MQQGATLVLAAFLGACAAYIVMQRTDSGDGSEQAGGSTESGVEVVAPIVEDWEQAAAEERKVIAYYFHGDFRCATCRKIEALSHEAVSEGFADALAKGRLEWRVVNTDAQESQHFIEDYQLASQSLVLAELTGSERKRWKNLERVWLLVDDREGFIDYVRRETSAFLGARP